MKMKFFLLLMLLPVFIECKPVFDENMGDFEAIIIESDELLGELNGFEKQLAVEQTLTYLQKHLTGLQKAAKKLNDENINKILAKIESDLTLSQLQFEQTLDLKAFDESSVLIGVQILELQLEMIERLTADQTKAEKEEIEELKPGFYQIINKTKSSVKFEDRIKELWEQLNRFTYLINDMINNMDNM
jgi:hypothetical protein